MSYIKYFWQDTITMAKMEDKIKKILEEHLDKMKSQDELIISSKIPSIFTFGVFVGIVLSYSILVSILCGCAIGIMIGVNYVGVVKTMVDKVNNMFNEVYGVFVKIEK